MANRFLERLNAGEVLVADGATGTNLQKMGVKVVKDVDKSGFSQISKPIQDKLAKDLGPNAVKVLALVREVK